MLLFFKRRRKCLKTKPESYRALSHLRSAERWIQQAPAHLRCAIMASRVTGFGKKAKKKMHKGHEENVLLLTITLRAAA